MLPEGWGKMGDIVAMLYHNVTCDRAKDSEHASNVLVKPDPQA